KVNPMMQKMKESYSFFTPEGTGSWEITEDSVSMKGWKNLTLKKSHVLEITNLGALPLNKVSVELKYFDMFGGSEAMQFAMREADFRAFKAAVGK
ncbi:MAG: hypothetical protein ABH863_01085, partial [Candidatus Micrarchaeota archaeon]